LAATKKKENMEWIIKNKDWIFSGIGVFILGLIINWFRKGKSNSQTQKSGSNSTNFQSGRDINIK
jgi:plastocyanin domain-containing protein